MAPLQLAPGLYTVVWTTVSAADGHRSQGSFPFMIAAGTQPAVVNLEAAASPSVGPRAAAPADETLPPIDVAVRWFNFLALVWSVGSIAFVVLALSFAGFFRGVIPAYDPDDPYAEMR